MTCAQCNDIQFVGLTTLVGWLIASESGMVCYVRYTVWPEILAGNLFWQIGGFESNPPIFHPPNSCTV